MTADRWVSPSPCPALVTGRLDRSCSALPLRKRATDRELLRSPMDSQGLRPAATGGQMGALISDRQAHRGE